MLDSNIHESAADRLDLIRERAMDDMIRLRADRVQVAIDEPDLSRLADRLLELGDQITEQEDLLKSIDAAFGDLRRAEITNPQLEAVA